MLSFYKIFTVARYEMKTLLRSWFFRIFSILAILILTLVNVGIHTSVGRSPWFMNGINSSLPYMNILLLNVVQAIIGVFLASDFLKRDKKLDTTEVIYMRSMTNGDYVLGKSIGILLVFLALNLLVLLLSAVFHIFFSQASFTIMPYLYYPIFISIPTLVFIFGLSFLFMVLIRNQAVTFIVLLGYIATTLFFLSDKLHYVFDYMAFNIPLTYSDFIGFGNMDRLLIHRGIYFLFGVGFIFATILLIKRLPQSRLMTRLSALISGVCLATAVGLIFIYLSQFSAGSQLRQEMRTLNSQYGELAKPTPLSCKINLTHKGSAIEAEADYRIQNTTQAPIAQYIFSINPGLRVKDISNGDNDLSFEQKKQIILVSPQRPLTPGGIDSLRMIYSGKIDERACYLDIDDTERQSLYRLWMYNVAKRFAILQPNYVLLTPEAMWYPVAGVPYGAIYPQAVSRDFIQFELSVQTRSDLTAISQGEPKQTGAGVFKFGPEQPLPQLSLVIGKYQKKSITVDSVEYNLFNLKQHDYYAEYFTELGDTISALIREQRQDYEGKLGLSYPFSRFSVVEVPVQFYHYQRIWTTAIEAQQPEMALVQEKAILMNG
ncbi:MAG: xanthan lyase, partial [bacterium]|nr:xanthan lyase [bacterium]